VHRQLDGGVPAFDHRVGDAEPGEQFQGPRLHGERPGLVDPVELAIDEPESGPERLELTCKRQAGRASPDGEHIDRTGHPCAASSPGFLARTNTDQKPSATGWLSTISTSANPASTSWER
jgi:hypothetical protein